MSFSKWLTGIVALRCEGGYPERFLNAAAELGVALWDVRITNGVLHCHTRASDYRRLRAAARYGRTRMRLERRRGLVFHLRRFHLRFGLALGLLLFIATLHVLSSRIWVIQIHGNRTVSDMDIRTVLEPLGIREGASFNDVNLTDVRLNALQRLPTVTWLTVNQSGSILTVEVRERTPVEPLPDTSPANLIASCDGTILSVTTISGQAVVKPGDVVSEGDLLISGVVDSTVGPQLKRADGSVIARTTRTLTVTVPFLETATDPAARVIKQPSLVLFGWQIPLYTDHEIVGSPTVVTETLPLEANGVSLPIGWQITHYRYAADVTIRRTDAEAKTAAEQRLSEAEETLRQTMTVEDCTVHETATTEGVTLTAIYTGTVELAVAVPIA